PGCRNPPSCSTERGSTAATTWRSPAVPRFSLSRHWCSAARPLARAWAVAPAATPRAGAASGGCGSPPPSRATAAAAAGRARGAPLDGARATAMLLWAAPDAAARVDEVRALLAEAPCTAGASAWNGLLSVRAAAPDARDLQAELGPVITRLTGRPLQRVWQ